MSNAHHPEKIEAAGAPGDTAIIGSFMARRNTVRAETLARLLNGERLTGLGAVAASASPWRIPRHDSASRRKSNRLGAGMAWGAGAVPRGSALGERWTGPRTIGLPV